MTAECITPGSRLSLLEFFGMELRRVRTEAGMSQHQAATAAFTTQSMVCKIERARQIPSESLAIGLDRAFGTGGHFERLHRLVLDYAYPSWFLPYVELEQRARTIRDFASQVVPGLLQTEGYARAMFTAVRPDNLDDLIAARLSRQAILDRKEPPHTWYVLDEQVLRRKLGGPEVMRAQYARLLQAGKRPRTVIQVVPERVTSHAGLAGSFITLSFAEHPDVLYVDGFSQGRMSVDAVEVADALRAYDLLMTEALSHGDSAALISDYMEGLST